MSESTNAPRLPDGRFRNVVPRRRQGILEMLALFWKVSTTKPKTAVPDQPLPVQPLTAADIASAPDASLWRLGHSTMLFKLAGRYWLTDPVFSERAAPVQWAGPKRFHAPPIGIDALPPLAGVILSHDHYDHLDYASIRRLIPQTALFVAPLGVGDRIVRWGVDPAEVRQLDWWQSTDVEGLRLTAAPSRHFSGRSLSDGDRTLWVSWVIEAAGYAAHAPGALTTSLRLPFGASGISLSSCSAMSNRSPQRRRWASSRKARWAASSGPWRPTTARTISPGRRWRTWYRRTTSHVASSMTMDRPGMRLPARSIRNSCARPSMAAQRPPASITP